MKKLWTITMIGLLVLVLAACSSGDGDDQTTLTSESVPLGIVTTEAFETEAETETSQSETLNEENDIQNVLNPDKKVDNYYYEYIMSSNGQHMASFKIWVNGPRIRFDMIDDTQSIFLDYDKNEGYVYMPEGNVLMKMPLESLGSEWESPFIFAGEIDQEDLNTLQYRGTETIDGKVCNVYVSASDDMQVTYYIWRNEGLIVKIEYVQKDQPSYEYYFKDLVIGESYDAELRLPENADIIDMTKQP